MSREVIQVFGLGKLYHLGVSRQVKAHEAIERTFRRLTGRRVEQAGRTFWALKDCSFSLRQGEVAAIVGRNGAGKSVLLKMLSRVIRPTEGRAVLRGRVVSLLELGSGFDPEMTGRENIFMNGAILGVRQGQMAARFDRIVAFAGLENFIDEPAKHYSSGMFSRLAFAVAAHVDADVLLIDESLAVGDATFQEQCIAHLQGLAARGTSALFVTHSPELVMRLCDRGLVIEGGRLVFDGSVEKALRRYPGGDWERPLARSGAAWRNDATSAPGPSR